ncbi:alpha-galactosidase [Denitrobaculum tricleocarpae]|uniref:Alpha-galactosidase n=1 Tax=Denitrobaculum tricleocarpae TaxID=2591009 RepID=A0A545TUJ6_9PROT|nr:alpha-galactosidase [Denitrobaculum tricleocarpae]TQV80882.1 alpha-galactosidase [Denitrobaculum tricleocarpae]
MKSAHYRLDSSRSTLLLEAPATGSAGTMPRILYWGTPLAIDEQPESLARALTRPALQGGLDDAVPLTLSPSLVNGFPGQPALSGHRKGRNALPGFPDVSVKEDNGSWTILAKDTAAGLTLQIVISLAVDSNVLTMKTRLTNDGTADYDLQWCAAATLPIPSSHEEILSFRGRWCGEFQTARRRAPVGILMRENRRGRTSHDSFPAMILGTEDFNETTGAVIGAHLAWSGNHRVLHERLPDGTRQLQMGELLLPGEVMLGPGQSYQSPDVCFTISDEGLGGLSSNFHRFLRSDLLPPQTRKPRPVTLNTWEAIYFDHAPEKLSHLAKLAAQVGVERFVLDDGWFKDRNDDRTSLGDWVLDEKKYPHGLEPLISEVQDLGMAFGLWVEPEMVNPDSDLFRAHPDWVLHLESLQEPTGRYQHVLNLTRPEAAQYLFDSLDALLKAYPISYLKWDMNRDLSHQADGQSFVTGQQTKALYALIDRLRESHPTVEIESCASGGGRADFGILRRTHRIWASDSNDAHDRQSIQQGFSLFFPPEIMGAHIGPMHCHTTGRRLDLDFRAITAFFGHFGLEADLSQLSEDELSRVTDYIALHKDWRSILHSGRVLRQVLEDGRALVFGVLAQDLTKAMVSYAVMEQTRDALAAPLRLPGLDPDRFYRVCAFNQPSNPGRRMKNMPDALFDGSLILSGRAIAGSGIQIPVLDPDTALLLQITESGMA